MFALQIVWKGRSELCVLFSHLVQMRLECLLVVILSCDRIAFTKPLWARVAHIRCAIWVGNSVGNGENWQTQKFHTMCVNDNTSADIGQRINKTKKRGRKQNRKKASTCHCWRRQQRYADADRLRCLWKGATTVCVCVRALDNSMALDFVSAKSSLAGLMINEKMRSWIQSVNLWQKSFKRFAQIDKIN